MGILSAWNGFSDLRTKKVARKAALSDMALRQNESAAKVQHTNAEMERMKAEAELKSRQLDHEIQKFHIDTRFRQAILQEQLDIVREARARGANIRFNGVHISYPAQEQIEGPADLAAQLPGKIDFVEILQNWRPSFEQIFLGLKAGGEPVVVPLPALCHVALAGSTGAGKSNLMRMLLAQLLYVGTYVCVCDPHYAPVDAESGEDWRPIERRLAVEPAVSPQQIKNVLKWAAVDALPKRLEMRRQGKKVGKPIFIALDELPSIVAKVPEVPDYLAEIGREGRKVGIFLISSSQDFLVKTVGGSGAARDNFRTALYGGGDATTARVLLDVKGRVDDGSLGKGVVMCRSQATPQATFLRVPYASNESIYKLLPGSVDDEEDEAEEYAPPPASRVVAALPPGPPPETDMDRVVKAWNAGHQSIGKVAAATGLSHWQARVMLDKAKILGKITHTHE